MKVYLVIPLSLFYFSAAFGQIDVLIQGKIVNQIDGVALPNVSIQEKNTHTKSVSDFDGTFNLAIKGEQAVLFVSHLGYNNKTVTIKLPLNDSLVIALTPEVKELREVVVSTGYEDIAVERATGSFELVDNTLFNRQITSDVISRLDGLVPGVLFDKRAGGDRSFRIRGISTLSSSALPLIILDNFPYEGDIRNINPNEIENVTLLKDAAAASIWGAKAGNGVLVITTKKAGMGTRPKVNVSSNLTFVDEVDLFYEPRMSSSDFIDVERFLFEQGTFNSLLNNTSNRPVITPVVEILQRERAGELAAAEAEALIDEYRNKDIRRDYETHFYRRAMRQQHALALSGGSEHITYRASIGYDRNLHQLIRNHDDRLTIRLNNNFILSPSIEFNADISYATSNRETNNPGAIRMGTTGAIYPYASLLDDEGQPAVVEQQYRLSYVDTAGNGKLLDWKYRPLEELYQADTRSNVNHLMLNFGATYKILPALSLSIKYQFANQAISDNNIQSEDLFYTRDYINRFTQIEGDNMTHHVPVGGIYDFSENELRSHAIRGQLNLMRMSIKKHEVFALLGVEARQSRGWLYQDRAYGYDSKTKTRQSVDLVNRFPIYDRLYPFSLPLEDRQLFYETNDRFLSSYVNISYSYDNRYTISGSMRHDASNIFGTNTNNKWKPLWSAGIKWNVLNERFFNSNVFERLTLKATYGHSGNVNNDVPAVATIRYDNNVSVLAGRPFAYIENPPNPELRWENVATSNFELAFSTKQRRLEGSIAYYRKKSSDLIGAVNVDRTTGYRLLTTNSAMVENSGIGASLTHRRRVAGVVWSSFLIYANHNSKLLRYLYESGSLNTYITRTSVRPPAAGYPLNSIFSYKWRGLDGQTGDPIGVGGDGELSKDYNRLTNPASLDEIVYSGTAMPKHFGAFRNDFIIKDFMLSINVTYRFDYYFRRNTIYYSALLRGNPTVQHGDFSKRWQAPGDENRTSIPSMTFPANGNRDQFYENSEATIEKGDHIRLQDINVSYNLPQRVINPLKIQQIKITFYANNLGIIWKHNRSGRDPDYNQTPLARSFALGLNIQF